MLALEKGLADFEDRSNRIGEILTYNREIVAFARWQFPYSPSAAQQAEKETLQKATPSMPAGYNKELFNHFSSALDKLQEKWVDHSKDHGRSCPPLSLSHIQI